MKIVMTVNTKHPEFLDDKGGSDMKKIAEKIRAVAAEVVAGSNPFEGQLNDNMGEWVLKWHMRPVSAISVERAQEILKLGSSTFGNYSKFTTPDEDREVRRLWAFNTSGNSSWYSTLCRIAAGDYESGVAEVDRRQSQRV